MNEWRIKIENDDFSAHAILPWIDGRHEVSLKQAEDEFACYSDVQSNLQDAPNRAFCELVKRGLIKPISEHILPEKGNQQQYSCTYMSTHLGQVAVKYHLSLNDAECIRQHASILIEAHPSRQFSVFDLLLVAAANPGFEFRQNVTWDMEYLLQRDLESEASSLIANYGTSLPKVLGITPIRLRSAIEAAEIASSILSGEHCEEIAFDQGLAVEHLAIIMREIRRYLSALADLLVLEAVAASSAILSIYKLIAKINLVRPSSQPLPLLPKLSCSLPPSTFIQSEIGHNQYHLEAGGIEPDFEAAGIDVSSGIDVLQEILIAKPDTLAKLFSTLEIGTVMQNGIRNALVNNPALGDVRPVKRSNVISPDEARNFIRYLFRQGY